MKFGERSTKFDGLIGEPVESPFVSDEQRGICDRFSKMAGRKSGWHYASIAYHVTDEGAIDLIGDTKVYSTGDDQFVSRIERVQE